MPHQSCERLLICTLFKLDRKSEHVVLVCSDVLIQGIANRSHARCAQEAAELNTIISGELPAGWEDALPTFTPEDKALATRLHSQTMLNALANVLPGAHSSTPFYV